MIPVPAEAIGPSMLALTALASEAEWDARLGASFYPAGIYVERHLHAIASCVGGALNWRTRLFARARAEGAAVVQVVTGVSQWTRATTRPVRCDASPRIEPADGEEFSELSIRALKARATFSANRYRHRAITEGLRTLLFESDLAGGIEIGYSDGSESPEFCLERLSIAASREDAANLSILLVTERHHGLELVADLALMRNAELRPDQTMAEQELIAATRTREILESPALVAGGVIDAYHTGLEPVVVGFYRSVSEDLRRRSRLGAPTLTVRPMYIQPARAPITCSREAADALVTEYAQVLRVVRTRRGRAITEAVVWLLDRPMAAQEKDRLVASVAETRPIVEDLFQRSQYQPGAAWGPCGAPSA